MIFVTVGTTRFPFDRLLRAVDEAMAESKFKDELVVQSGASDYKFKYPKTKVFKEIPFNKMIFYTKKANVIITHGGPATIFLALKYGKNKPFVVPRRKEFAEHTDNHQEFFANEMRKKGLMTSSPPVEGRSASWRIGRVVCLFLPHSSPAKGGGILRREIKPVFTGKDLVPSLLKYLENPELFEGREKLISSKKLIKSLIAYMENK